MTFRSRHALAHAPRGHGLSRAIALLVVTHALACGVQDGSGGEAEQAPVGTLAPLPTPEEAITAENPTEAPAPAASPAVPSLEDLLRLPSSVVQMDPVTRRPRRPRGAGGAEKTDEQQRVRLELEARDDAAALRPSAARSRTDAGVSVPVAERVRLRGGVRLEEESGREPDEPMPTVGIEKRF